MNDNNQKNVVVSFIIVIVFIAVAVGYAIYHPNPVVKNIVTQELPASNCGLSVQSPMKGQEISTTTGFDVEAVLDNRDREALGCSWTAFEAQTGVVYVKDINGQDIATPTPLGTIEEWMTETPVNYFAHISILNNYTGPAMVIIEEENPSGENPSKTISFPVMIVE